MIHIDSINKIGFFMSTLQDVAQHAGVSVSTVSRVVNNYPHVRTEVRERVLASISVLNYRPNKIARGLRRQNSQIVGVLVRLHSTPFSSELTYAIERTLFDKNYQVLLCNSNSSPELENSYIDLLIEQQVSGVILRPTRFSDHSVKNIEKLLKNKIRVVSVDIAIPDANISQILTKNQEGGYLAMQHLVEYGHRHIAIIAPSIDQDESLNFPGNLRIRGINQAVEEYHGEVQPVFIFNKEWDQFKNGYSGMQQVIESYPQVTAVFGITDMVAIGAMHAAFENGISIPQDMSIMGFDGVAPSEYVVPPLTTMVQPIHQMGIMAARTLLDHMKDEDAPTRSIIMENRLQIRGSTGINLS